MLKKEYFKTKKTCRVTFYTPKLKAESVNLVGYFNDWDENAMPMEKLKDSRFKLIIELEKDKEYQYRFFVNQEEWINDLHADYCVKNEYGSENCVVRT